VLSREPYGIDQEYANPVPCSEYSASLQISLFDILQQDMPQPVLDIGCGIEGNLVGFLRRCGIEAYGIDRFHDPI
jgi:2-polyprenyl-3-methyl-5-hydroxy-6-metoxy-1,4-benzoquinol methylase